MKLDNLKYGFLISVTTLFGGSKIQLLAQNADSSAVPLSQIDNYKHVFQQSVSPKLNEISVDFIVDSVATKSNNGEFHSDVNIIQLLAYLDQNSDEYQSYMASRHIVAHEMWHRICIMNDVLEQPMSATQYRIGRDNFEITGSIVQLLTFRDDYIHATPQQRQIIRTLDDPKIKMYILAVEQGVIDPLSNDKKDFDFEMEFIAKLVSGYWNNNLAVTYASLHNDMTEKSGRKEFNSPRYEKNFVHDIKKMNTIGGIDFSQYYNFRDVRLTQKFDKAYTEDTNIIQQDLSAPNLNLWINKKSQLKRFSKQHIVIPNFTGNRLAQERVKRPFNLNLQSYKIAPMSADYKAFPLLKVPFYEAITVFNSKKTLKFFPHGAVDIIDHDKLPDGTQKISTLYLNGCRETGFVKNRAKIGTFSFYDQNGRKLAVCSYQNNRPFNGDIVLPAAKDFILYSYKNGKLTSISQLSLQGKKKVICTFNNGKPVLGMVPVADRKNSSAGQSYLAYLDGKLSAELVFDNLHKLAEKQKILGDTIVIKRFYDNGATKYQAVAKHSFPSNKLSLSNPPILNKQAPMVKEQNHHPAMHQVEHIPSVPRTPSKSMLLQNIPNVMLRSSSKLFQRVMQISKEAFFAKNGTPVLISQKNDNTQTYKVKLKEFFNAISAFSLPQKEKNIIVAGFLKMKQRIFLKQHSLLQNKNISASNSLSNVHKRKLVKSLLTHSGKSRKPLNKTFQKLSLLKNKMRFLTTKRHDFSND